MATRRTQSARPVKLSRWRINALLLVAMLFGSCIIGQLGNLQILQHNTLTARADSEIDRTVTIQPSRGVIRDRLGNVLALDVDRESLFVTPSLIAPADAPKISLVLAGLLGKPAQDIQALLTDQTMSWVAIQRWLDPAISEQIAKLDEPGLQLIHEPRRVYPQGQFAAQVVGAVNFEGVGLSGVEGFYDTQLKGITGTLTAEWDANSNPIWITPPQSNPASNGADLELTLDPLVQHVIETELKKAMDAHGAESGTVIVMDPKTGAIRGMVSYPTFDPNRYNEYAPEIYNQNPAISQIYEPGSTFKILTVAAGLQARAFTADTEVNDPGVVLRYDTPLRNYNGGGHGMITPGQVLYYSSNVGALQFNEKTGVDAFYKAVKAFGYGEPTGIDMAGEGAGIVKDPNNPDTGWVPIDLDTNSYGQGIAVTPLQQVRMVAAIANDGKLMKPFIVQKVCHGESCTENKPQEVGQPVEPGVAWTVRRMLVKSANGYAPLIWAPKTGSFSDTWLVPGHEVGAKTGTSDVPDGQGGYTGQVIGSVAGLAPADDARYAILVKIDKPKDDAYGVVTAIPVFQAIVDQLLRYDRVPPNPGLVGDGQTIGMVTR